MLSKEATDVTFSDSEMTHHGHEPVTLQTSGGLVTTHQPIHKAFKIWET